MARQGTSRGGARRSSGGKSKRTGGRKSAAAKRSTAARKRSTSRATGGTRYSAGAGKSVASAMRRRKKGTLRRGKAGHGGKVTDRDQAIAIGLSEARKKGARVPPERSGSRSRAATAGKGGRRTSKAGRKSGSGRARSRRA